MGHGHGVSAAAAYRGRLAVVLAVTVVVLVVELVGAALSGSLALVADAGHVLADAAGIALALGAVWFAARPATPQRTFGYYRLEILAAVGNAVLLLGVAGVVLWEAARRLTDPPAVASGLMVTVAVVGLVANAGCLWLLRDGQRHSLNLRGAYLEVWGDLLGSVAVLAAAAVIALTGLRVADPVASAVIAVAILARTWRLLREAVEVLLEAAPRGVDLGEVRRHLLATPGVAGVHDLHAWTITSGLPVVSVHVVVAGDADAGRVLDGLGACLAGHFDIEHSTFQLEQPEHRNHEGTTHR
jgi:cobalt-zinc-cadmium efflux system protein